MIKFSIILWAFLMLFCTTCGIRKTKKSDCPINSVKVIINNRSNHDIVDILLEYHDAAVKVGRLRDNDKTFLCFDGGTENSYHLTIVLDNGDTLKSNGAYVEGGYTMIETVFADSIVTKYAPAY